MTLSMKRVFAILQKDYKDMSRNLYVSTTLLMPIVLSVIYGRMGAGSIDTYYLVFNMTFVLVTAYVQASLIAEEKEKNTLRGLMLSPASTLEIFCGKNLLSFLATVLIVTVCMALQEYNPQNMPVVIAALFLSVLFYLGLGTLIGLFTKSVMEASVAVLPFFAIFSFGSYVTLFIEQYPFLSVLEALPNLQLLELAKRVEAGAGFADTAGHLGIILAWAVAIHILAAFVYKKRMVDE
ncbi:ABC transporter permease [Cohnella massiliensis]|uniref:ABC transporter permease n=1 Tax=Cohnella massiliensis TaxID=1816691 RepID=UPI0009BAA741|nr:ABC transporter permease [Cohnella massiliensis]